jgi:hypothetical protein
LCFFLSVFSIGCRKGNATTSDAGGSASASASVSEQVAIEKASTDQKWVDARGGDALELARLADAVGADDLAEVAGDAKKDEGDRETAIRALAFVDDPTPALDTLTRVAAAGGTTADRALETIAEVAPKRAPTEEVEPTAWRACGEGLLVAAPTIRDTARRKLLIAALLALADRGTLERSAIPAQ